jgi:hypothetical protein
MNSQSHSFNASPSAFAFAVLCNTAFFILHHLGTVIPTFAIFGEGESATGYNLSLGPAWDQLLDLGWHIDIQVQGISRLRRSNQCNVPCPRSQSRWSMTGIEITIFGSRFRQLTTRLCIPRVLLLLLLQTTWCQNKILVSLTCGEGWVPFGNNQNHWWKLE